MLEPRCHTMIRLGNLALKYGYMDLYGTRLLNMRLILPARQHTVILPISFITSITAESYFNTDKRDKVYQDNSYIDWIFINPIG